MPYPESFIGPMREELTRLGVQELRDRPTTSTRSSARKTRP